MEKHGVGTNGAAAGDAESILGTARTIVNRRDVNGSKRDGVWLSAELHRSPVHEQ